MKTRKKRCLINSVDDEVWFDSVPNTHQAEGEKITGDSRKVPISDPSTAGGRQQKTHVNVVTEPEGKRDIPTVPEISDISCQEGTIEIFWRMNAEKVTEGDGKGAVPSEIEKQIETVGVH